MKPTQLARLISLIGALAYLPSASAANVATLDLPALLNLVIDNNPSMQAQAQTLKAAGYSVDTAAWQYVLTPSFSVQQASTANNDPSYQGDKQVSVFALQQPLWTGGKLDAGMEKAHQEQQQAQSSFNEIRQDLRLKTIQAFADWSTARLRFQAFDNSVNAHTSLYERIQRRVQEGLSTESDLTLARSRLDQVKADQWLAKMQEDSALSNLSQLSGEKITSQRLAMSSAMPISTQADDAVNQMLAVNPSIRRSEASAAVALSEVEIQKSAHWPDVYLRLEQQHGNFMIRGADSDVRVILGMQSKFGAGLSTLSAIEGAKAKHQASVLDIESSKRIASQQILSEWINAHHLTTRLDALKTALMSAQQIQASWDRQFVLGKKSWLDVMNAAREVSQLELQLAEATGSLLNSSWKLAVFTQAQGTQLAF